MSSSRPWERSYPPALQDYRLDSTRLPQSLELIAGESRAAFGMEAAFTLVLPNALTASLSFAAVDAHADDFAAYLSSVLGLQLADVVAIQLPNSLHYPVAVFGSWRAGLIVTNVNPLYTERELRDQLRDSGAKVLVVHSASLETAAKLARELGIHVVVAGLWEFFAADVGAAIRARLVGDLGPDGAAALATHASFESALAQGRQRGRRAPRHHPVALYQYTGGTTGRSKAAVLTHANVGAVLQMTGDFLDAYDAPFTPRDVMLTALPLYHVFAFVINFLMIFRHGARNVLIPNPRPLANLRPAFEQFPITWMTGVDTLYAGLLAEPWFREQPPKLKYAISGGTALRPTTGRRWGELVCPLLEGYGMTETSCIVSFNPPGSGTHDGSVGLPMPGSDVRVVGSDGQPVAPGERGELQVRGPHVAEGYLDRPAETALAIVDGWLRTGDVVVMDPDGWITIVDRLKDMVLVSGFNVYPNEVEAVIAAHPDVVEVAVIGVPDEGTGEAVCAHVVKRNPDLTEGELIQFCRGQLTSYKVPKQIRFVAQLPKSPVGKILRAQLRQAA
ncbi:MAG: AMP-binding protein [Proteobacteria bacterium]|nr:AMP-binding protein [Pseudomonadota bacterium]